MARKFTSPHPTHCSVAVIERTLGIPRSGWPGNCYSIASQMVERGLVHGVAIYGHYLGPINPRGYWHRYAGHPFVQHGWIKLDDSRTPTIEIMDPTRWVFEHRIPYIALFRTGDPEIEQYDEGGNLWRAALRRPCPRPELGEKLIRLELSAQAQQLVAQLIPGSSPAALPTSQLLWLANAPYDALAPLTAEILVAIKATGLGAMVPIDNMRRAEREYD